jgi:isocitrate dehydrogenase kinase/phosphatase
VKIYSPRQVAQTILDGFAAYRHQFINITLGARDRFESQAWRDVQRAAQERIDLYENAVEAVHRTLSERVGYENLTLEIWAEARRDYIILIQERTDPELCETFFNSIYCDIFRHQNINDETAFLNSWFGDQGGNATGQVDIFMRYSFADALSDVCDRILDDYEFSVGWADRKMARKHMIAGIEALVPNEFWTDASARFELLKPVFYRNKGAYLVGRLVTDEVVYPIVFALMHRTDEGIEIDAVIVDPEEVSVVFSFTRSYFMVDVPIPVDFVAFLQTLMPSKQKHELYSAIGFYKHGKTEFVRVFKRHLIRSDDQFVIAPGIKGLVMCVFTLPSSEIVFKLIKDKFGPSKNVTRQVVLDKYHLVKVHDRVGRMADTQEFSNFALPLERFDPECLDELMDLCANSVSIEDEQVVIKHLYIERRMTPLNLYLESASDEARHNALDEYGQAIKQLAAANIFPGDMLLKNFGVTRHGRVVFYDYDEISYLTEVNFRKIPEPQTYEQEMASEPWYHIAPEDVFPEEFATFLFPSLQIRKEFAAMHGDLFDAEYWIGLQARIRDGQMMEFFPYKTGVTAPGWSIV